MAKFISDKKLLEAGFIRLCDTEWYLNLNATVCGSGLDKGGMIPMALVYSSTDCDDPRDDNYCFYIRTGDGSSLHINARSITSALSFTDGINGFVSEHSISKSDTVSYFNQFSKNPYHVPLRVFINVEDQHSNPYEILERQNRDNMKGILK